MDEEQALFTLLNYTIDVKQKCKQLNELIDTVCFQFDFGVREGGGGCVCVARAGESPEFCVCVARGRV